MALMVSASFVISAPIVLKESTSLIMYSFPSSTIFTPPMLPSQPQEINSISPFFHSKPLFFKISVASPIIYSIWTLFTVKRQQLSAKIIWLTLPSSHPLIWTPNCRSSHSCWILLKTLFIIKLKRHGLSPPSLLDGLVEGNVRNSGLLEANVMPASNLLSQDCTRQDRSNVHLPQHQAQIRRWNIVKGLFHIHWACNDSKLKALLS